jgi:excisionase family DNA binding protein
MGNGYISPEEVAKVLVLGVETVRRYLRSGKLIGVRVSGKCWRISEAELNIFIRRRMTRP